MKQNFTQKLLLVLCILLSMQAKNVLYGQIVQVGTGSTYSYYAPIYSCYNYNYSQVIYTADEILAANGNIVPVGPITSIKFRIDPSSYHGGTANFNNWEVYMGFVAQGSFTSTTNWVPFASLTQVHNGAVTIPAAGNWMNINLSTPQMWNGTSNIVIAVREVVSGYNCTAYFTASSTGTTYKTMYFYDDNTIPSASAPPTADGRSYTRPNIQFDFQLPACNASTTYPASATTTASKTSVCPNTSVNLTFNPVSNLPQVSGLTYQWQSAPAATGPWTNIGTAVAAPNTTVTVATSTYYRAQLLCAGTPTTLSSTPVLISSENPLISNTAGATRCGPGSVTLTATPNSGSTIKWYDALNGYTPVATGNSFVTPNLVATTTYYATAVSSTNNLNVWVGTGTSSSSTPNPYYSGYDACKNQFLIRASELTALGLTAGPISSLAFDVLSVVSLPLTNYTVAMKNTTTTALTTTWETAGLTTVFTSSSYLPTVGVNEHIFSTPFIWDGTSNLLIQTCFANSSYNYSHLVKATTGLSFNASHYEYQDGNSNFCTNPTGYNYTSTTRPNIRLKMDKDCESTRMPVVATITNAIPVTINVASNSVCNNEITNFSISSPLGNYTSYTWTPLVSNVLYTDALATTQYVSGNATTLYFKSNQAGVNRIALRAENSVTGCSFNDTINIFVQPNGSQLQITSDKDTLCLTGNVQVNVNNMALYNGATKSWYQSNDGITYTAFSPTLPFSTGTINGHKYYRIVTSGSNGSCDTISKLIYVGNPTVNSVWNNGRCGPGSVDIAASGNPGESLFWFENSNDLVPIHIGDTFTTPYISNTTTFYVASGVGRSQPSPTWINTGTQSFTTSNPNPFYTFYYGNKTQSLIKASELTALGFAAGQITEIAWNIGTVVVPNHTNFTVKMKQTSATTHTAFDNNGLTTVYTVPSATISANSVFNIVLQTPFAWDGVSNILIETCFNNSNWSSSNGVEYGNVGFASSVAYYADNSSVCASTTVYSSSNYRPNMRFKMTGGCLSAKVPVVANISEKPDVDLGPNIDKCIDPGQLDFLNARNPGLNYRWDNGYNGQVRVVDASGTYWVEVDNNGCKESDTVEVVYKPNPISTLGNDTTTCVGAKLTLDAGNGGAQYMWNTGHTTSQIEVDMPGTYSVVITGNNGCVKIDSVQVTQSGVFPTYNGIRVRNINANTFNFSLNNSNNVSSVSWDFGDGSPISYAVSPTHAYPVSGNYVVRVIANSVCGTASDTTTIHIKGYTDIADLENNDAIKVYPNPAQNYFVLSMENGTKIKQVNVLTASGRLVKVVGDINKSEVNIETDDLATGFYYLTIETKDGVYKRKLDIIK